MKIATAYKIPTLVVATFWLAEGFQYITDIDIDQLGIYPRTMKGLIGIFFSPFLHGSFEHLISNSAIFIILAGSVLYFFPKGGTKIILYIYLATGFGVWLFARPAYHIGASGLIYGFASMLFFSGIFRNELKYLVLSLIIAIFYGSMLYGIFPTDPGVSWESHLIGGLVGCFTAYQFRKVDSDSKLDPVVTQQQQENLEGYRNIENTRIIYTFKEKSGKDAD